MRNNHAEENQRNEDGRYTYGSSSDPNDDRYQDDEHLTYAILFSTISDKSERSDVCRFSLFDRR